MKVKLIYELSPSVNAAFRNVAKVGRVKTAKYKTWLEENTSIILQQLSEDFQALEGDLQIRFWMERSRKNSDLDNRLKTAIDILTTCGVFAKSDAQVVRITADWVEKNSIRRPRFMLPHQRHLIKAWIWQK